MQASTAHQGYRIGYRPLTPWHVTKIWTGWEVSNICCAGLQVRGFNVAARADHEGLCTVTEKAGIISVNEIPRLGVLVHERRPTRGDAGESPGCLILCEVRVEFPRLNICSWLGRGVGFIS